MAVSICWYCKYSKDDCEGNKDIEKLKCKFFETADEESVDGLKTMNNFLRVENESLKKYIEKLHKEIKELRYKIAKETL